MPHPTQPVEFDLWPGAHAVRRGHRIRLEVSRGAHPRYGRNHGTANPSPLAHAVVGYLVDVKLLPTAGSGHHDRELVKVTRKRRQ